MIIKCFAYILLLSFFLLQDWLIDWYWAKLSLDRRFSLEFCRCRLRFTYQTLTNTFDPQVYKLQQFFQYCDRQSLITGCGRWTGLKYQHMKCEWNLAELEVWTREPRVCHFPLFVTFFFRKCFICSSEVLGCQGYFCFCSSICIKVPSKPILIFQFFENLQYLNNLKWP